MINVYDDNEGGNKVKIFFSIKNGELTTITIGNQVVIKKAGIQFYVDEYVAQQLDKLELTMDGFSPQLKLKEGETLDIPDENEERIRELEEELERLKGEREHERSDL